MKCETRNVIYDKNKNHSVIIFAGVLLGFCDVEKTVSVMCLELRFRLTLMWETSFKWKNKWDKTIRYWQI